MPTTACELSCLAPAGYPRMSLSFSKERRMMTNRGFQVALIDVIVAGVTAVGSLPTIVDRMLGLQVLRHPTPLY
jgi:hypothetical protein